jgi:hypothetical protein
MTRRFFPFSLHPFFLLLPLVALFAPSCNDENAPDCFKSTGRTVQQRRPISAFTEIVLQDDIDLYLTHTEDSTVLVEAGENLMPKIEVTQQGTTLSIRNRNTCNWVRTYQRPVKVTVGVPRDQLVLRHLGFGTIRSAGPLEIGYLVVASFDASGDVQLDGKLDYIVLYANSPAHITLSGQSESLEAWLHGNFGRLTAEGLQTKVCKLRHDGSNEMRVFPLDELHATISANGTVAYYNEPAKIILTISKNGKLIRRHP